MFEGADYSKLDPGLVERTRGIEARLMKAGENGRLAHAAFGMLGTVRNLAFYAARWKEEGDEEAAAGDCEALEACLAKAAAFLSAEGL